MRVRIDRLERGFEVGGRRLAQDDRLRVGGVLQTRYERAGVEQRTVLRLPPAVLVQTVKVCAGLQFMESAREVHEGEHEVRLRRLVGTADENRLCILADELDTVEFPDDRVHRQCQHAFSGERTGRRTRRRLQLFVVE